MFPLRRSLPSLCLAFVLGLALAWPGLAHRRLHEHTHAEVEHSPSVPLSAHIAGSESDHDDHPHLDLIATAPTKAALQLALLVSQYPALAVSRLTVVRVTHDGNDSIRPRAPPPGPPPLIRAPPIA